MNQSVSDLDLNKKGSINTLNSISENEESIFDSNNEIINEEIDSNNLDQSFLRTNNINNNVNTKNQNIKFLNSDEIDFNIVTISILLIFFTFIGIMFNYETILIDQVIVKGKNQTPDFFTCQNCIDFTSYLFTALSYILIGIFYGVLFGIFIIFGIKNLKTYSFFLSKDIMIKFNFINDNHYKLFIITESIIILILNLFLCLFGFFNIQIFTFISNKKEILSIKMDKQNDQINFIFAMIYFCLHVSYTILGFPNVSFYVIEHIKKNRANAQIYYYEQM